MADNMIATRLTHDEARPGHHQRYVHPKTGRVMPLVIQSFDDPHHLPRTSQWTRLGEPASRVPSLFKVALWIGSSTIEEGTDERIYTPRALATAAAKMVIASPVVYCLMSTLDMGIPVFDQKANRLELDLRYDGVFNRDPTLGQTARSLPHSSAREESMGPDQRPLYSSNIRLNSHVTPRRTTPDPSAPWTTRTESTALSLRPRYLCFIEDFKKGTYETVQVSDYVAQHGEHVDTEFIFVSYTRMQFRVAKNEEIDAYSYEDEATREANRQIAKEDRATLVRWAIDAAHAAGKQAFWLDFECVRDTDGQARSTSSSEDVYRICDIVRASHSMIIGIGPSADDRVSALLKGEGLPEYPVDSQTRWLRQWGSRLWTLPELLLCPSEYRIKLYIAGDSDEPRELAKRNFAERAWDDADTVKDLVNHYEGSAILSPLLLIATALECFSRRKTDQFSPGDIAYAIMGLLPDRQRPKVNQTDSGFQAFARLSLAQEDGRFLERLICLLPPRRGAKWFDTEDLWGARLKDIVPSCQVVETGDADTIILDGTFGATINWDGIDGGDALTLIREVALMILMFGIALSVFLSKVWLIMMMMMAKLLQSHERRISETYFNWMAGVVLAVPLVFAVLGPLMVLWRSEKGIKLNKARLIGIEGFVDAGKVEKYLWGYNFGRLTQTSNIPVYRDAEGAAFREQSEQGAYAFTLVDTHSLTLTHFRASRPPMAMFVCGQEAGMQRALLCSYDADSNTYCRETVLRVHNKILEQMRKVDKFRFALEYPRGDGEEDVVQNLTVDDIAAKSEGIDGATEKILDDGKISLRLEWSFLVMVLLAYKTYLNVNKYYPRDPFEVNPMLPYGLSFIITQLPTHYLLFRTPPTRIIPSIALLKGFLVCFHELLSFDSYEAPLILTVIEGFTDSAFLAVFVVFTWSWYTLDRLPARMLIWSCALMVVAGFWEPLSEYTEVPGFVREGFAPFFYAGLCFYLSNAGSSVITTPGELTWLDAHKRVLYERRAAAYKWKIQGETSERPLRKHTLLSSPQPWLFLAASFLNALTMLPALRRHEWTEEPLRNITAAVVMLVLPCFILRRIPKATSLLVVVGLVVSFVASIIVHLTRSDDEIMLLRIQVFTTPLLWALIVPTTSTFAEGRWSLTLSLIGLGAGKILGIFGLNIAWTASASALEAIFVGCIWLFHRRRENQAARLLRARSIGEEYRDDVDGI